MKKQYINRAGELVTLDLDDNAPVPDGFGVRVPSFLQDGIPTTNHGITDAAGRPAGSRPGFLYDADGDESEARAAYDARSKLMQDAWRGTTTWPGAATHLRGAWHNMVNPPPPPAADQTQTIEAIRAQHKANLSNAWRSPPVADQAPPVTDSRPVTEDDLERERERRKRALSEAWRTPGGVGFGLGFGAA